jgi:hypothetical protein
MTKPSTIAAMIWTAILGIAAIFGSYFFACVFPFAAVATIAALTLDVRRGVALVTATWVANQVVGFAFMRFPQTFDTVALGLSLGVGALAAYAVACSVLRQARTPVRIVAALVGAFVAYQLVIYAGARGFGGADNFSLAIISGVALNDAIWFAGLSALQLALTRAVPALSAAPVARIA